MAGKPREIDLRQVAFAWLDPEEILRTAEERGGDVVFEAPDASRIVAAKPPRLPRVRVKRARGAKEPPSLGLPFGARRAEGRITCWCCGQELPEAEVVHTGPGYAACPGCGARLPLA